MAENWIIPCNTKRFDIIAHFQENDTVVWQNSFTIKKGDTVYLYLSAPYGEIKFKCTVISDTVSEEILSSNPYAIVEKKSYNYFSKKIKYIQLKKVCEYPEKTFTLQKLKEYGLGQVQIQARTDKKIQNYLDSIEILLSGGEEK